MYLLLSVCCSAQTRYCSKIKGEYIIKKSVMEISLNPSGKIPNYVGYYLTPEIVNGSEERELSFYQDVSVPEYMRSKSSDYTGSGYDRGHLAPAADFRSCKKLMHESFCMSNIAPQTPKLNRDYWLSVEKFERSSIKRCDTVYVVSVAICSQNRYLKNHVKVPSSFVKAVVGVKNHKIVVQQAWMFRNDSSDQFELKCRRTISSVEKSCDVDLFCGFWFDSLLQ